MPLETLSEKIKRVTAESVDVVDYRADWPFLFEDEKNRLQLWLPSDLICRIEHFGSTAVPGLRAKPIVDMVIEINDEDRAKTLVPGVLEPKGYDCFWRPIGNDNVPPFFTWCIRRDQNGARTHHLHFVKPGFKDNELRFRDLLRNNPVIARQYGDLKTRLSSDFHNDRIRYTEAKTEFIRRAMDVDTRSR
ncbi:MAG: GrpB family protein [Planctomycetota bacterium]